MRLRRRLALTALLLSTAGCGYNRIQELDEQVNASQGQIEVQLQRRSDLIPNLVETVKGFAQQEQTILTEIARANSGLRGALQKPGGADPEELANANANLTRAMVPFFTLIQAYPELKSNEQFLRLQDELAGTENRIAVSRTDYNTAVQQYNTYIRQFPAAMTAKVTGAKQRKPFQVTDPNAREVPRVDFGTGKAAPGGTAAPAAPGTPAPAGGAGATPPAGGTKTP
jgi:LemA protein